MPQPLSQPPSQPLPLPAGDATAPRSGAYDVVHARVLRQFPELVSELGGSVAMLLEQAAMPGDALAAGDEQVTYGQFVRLLECAATTLDCPDFGLRLAVRQGGGGQFGPLGEAMRNSRTLGEALEYVCDHIFAHSLAARVWLWPLDAHGDMFSGHDLLIEGAPNKAQAMENLLMAGQLSALALTDGRARVSRVHFRHQPVSHPRVYRRYFGCEVRFGQKSDGVVFSEAALASRIVSPDPLALERVRAHIDRTFRRQHPPVHADARGVIMRSIGLGDCSNGAVANVMRMHPRTLHRRLVAEGTTFQQVKDEVRRDILRYYLEQTDLDFTRISEKLGFAEQSVLTRKCRRWFAASPTQVRAAARRA